MPTAISKSKPPLRIALIHSDRPAGARNLNKDLNGGLGTADRFSAGFAGRALGRLKQRYVNGPVAAIAYAQASLRQRGHRVAYFDNALPDQAFDLALLRGSIVDVARENQIARELKSRFPGMRVGIFGPFPGQEPDSYPEADFVVRGEIEALCLHSDLHSLRDASGLLDCGVLADLDALPTPDYSGFPIDRYRYAPMLPAAPFLPLIASQGCPYSCGYYCTYGAFQGTRVRQRSAALVFEDMLRLRNRYGVRSIQFRDPVFGLNRSFVEELCRLLTDRPLGIEWGIETRSDQLDRQRLIDLQRAGLRSINIGIETPDAERARQHHRRTSEDDPPHALIADAKRLGLRVNAFFVLAFDGDDVESLRRTVSHALHLNPSAARFSVMTPYPGTAYYRELERAGRLTPLPWEHYTQTQLVQQHATLGAQEVERALLNAYLRFYGRPRYIAQTLAHLLGAWWNRSKAPEPADPAQPAAAQPLA